MVGSDMQHAGATLGATTPTLKQYHLYNQLVVLHIR